jgi:hypothetical protein
LDQYVTLPSSSLHTDRAQRLTVSLSLDAGNQERFVSLGQVYHPEDDDSPLRISRPDAEVRSQMARDDPERTSASQSAVICAASNEVSWTALDVFHFDKMAIVYVVPGSTELENFAAINTGVQGVGRVANLIVVGWLQLETNCGGIVSVLLTVCVRYGHLGILDSLSQHLHVRRRVSVLFVAKV